MPTYRIDWKTPPSEVAAKIQAWGKQVLAAMLELGDLFAQKLQEYAQANRPWTDQSSAARGGLRGFAEAAAASVTIYLVHSVIYGIFLEMGTSRMGARPIILPSIQAMQGEIMAALQALLA